jgi:DNA modification methylase
MNKVIIGDCRTVLKTLEADSVQCCVTSPPYFGLRDYGVAGQIGLEETPESYVAELVKVFQEVKRVLKPDGTLWLNLGDSYKDKNLIGIPWRVAFALQADGWYLRQDIIWAKSNPMPESVQDRCTKSHEYIFLLSKSPKYYFDNEAIKEKAVYQDDRIRDRNKSKLNNTPGKTISNGLKTNNYENRNRRSVWNINTRPYFEAHFAMYPPELVKLCLLAGTKPNDLVLDPFSGSGTTGQVCAHFCRDYIGIELNPNYAELREQERNVLALPL